MCQQLGKLPKEPCSCRGITSTWTFFLFGSDGTTSNLRKQQIEVGLQSQICLSLIPGCFSCLKSSPGQVFLSENGDNNSTYPTVFIARRKSTYGMENTAGYVNKCPLTVSLTIILLLFTHKVFADGGEDMRTFKHIQCMRHWCFA